MTKYIDFALVGELVVHGDVHYEDLMRLPAADVVEVVRCRDCKHFEKWYTEVTGDTGYYCTRPNQQTCNLLPEDYCSYAERKEHDNT